MSEGPARPPALTRLLSWRLMAHEWVVFLYIIVGLVVLESLPVSFDRLALLKVHAPTIALIVVGALIAVAVRRAALKRRGQADTLLPFRIELLIILRLSLAIFGTLAIHFFLKSFIYLLNPVTWDRQLYAIDQMVHLGFSPSRFVTTLFRDPAALTLFDTIYSRFYYFIVISYLMIFMGVLPIPRRLKFAAAFCFLWIASSLIYTALPSWGPVFALPEDFREAIDGMPFTGQVQRALAYETFTLVRDPLAPRMLRFGGIAAFPSLHIAVVTLIVITSRGGSRTWFRGNVIFLILMTLGSVLTGYHYLIDAYAGALLALGAWWVAGFLMKETPAASTLPPSGLQETTS